MATDKELINALFACAAAELNLPLTPEQETELIEIFAKNKNLGIDVRATTTIAQFVKGKKRGVFDSVSSSDKVTNKMRELQALLKTWNKQ